MEQSIIFISEMIGTVAFASSGALIGIRKRLDIFGVIVLGMTTAVGGGILRDVLLGLTPPNVFVDSSYALVALIVSMLLFTAAYVREEIIESRYVAVYEKVMNYCDAIGLGIFTVIGVHTAYAQGYRQKFFLIFLGILTGIGGGVIRDMMADTMPFILYKHIYAVAAFAGAFLCVQLISIHLYTALAAGAALIVVIRLLAARYCWDLPRAGERRKRRGVNTES